MREEGRGNLHDSPGLSSSFVLFSVLAGMRLRGFLSVVSSMQMVTTRDMGIMFALLMRAFFVMTGRLFVMAGRVLVMFSGLLVMFCSFMLRHLGFSILFIANPTVQNRNLLERPQLAVDSNSDRRGCRHFASFGMMTQRYEIAPRAKGQGIVDAIYDKARLFNIVQQLFSTF
jgi:hypothetical protein